MNSPNRKISYPISQIQQQCPTPFKLKQVALCSGWRKKNCLVCPATGAKPCHCVLLELLHGLKLVVRRSHVHRHPAVRLRADCIRYTAFPLCAASTERGKRSEKALSMAYLDHLLGLSYWVTNSVPNLQHLLVWLRSTQRLFSSVDEGASWPF